MLSIVGMPIPTTKTSGGDTGEARQLGDGWVMADLRADNDELMFKDAEIKTLELVLKICKTNPNCEIKILEPEECEIKFERNKSDNLLVKTQSLMNLINSGVAEKPAYSAVGLFSDPNAVVEESIKRKKEKQKEFLSQTTENITEKGGETSSVNTLEKSE